MSLVSGTGAVHLTNDVRDAVAAVSRRFDFSSASTAASADSSSPRVVPFCTLKLVDGSQSTFTIDVASSSDDGVPATWESLVASLPRDRCRMAVAQVPWRAHADGVMRSRQVFILWAPDSTSTKERMVASMFAKGAKGLIDQWGGGMSLPIQAAGVDDLALEDIEDKIRAKATVK